MFTKSDLEHCHYAELLNLENQAQSMCSHKFDVLEITELNF